MQHKGEDVYKLMGVDPGTNLLGFAIIEICNKKIKLVEYGAVSMAHLSTHQQKLNKIFERLRSLIEQYQPREMAIEAPFFGKNVQSMLKLGRAQGVAMVAATTKGIIVSEYAPKRIKQSITGSGRASKEQVAAMLENILGQKLDNDTLDATDALGVAVCHYFSSTSVLGKQNRHKGWKGFITNNPNRVK